MNRMGKVYVNVMKRKEHMIVAVCDEAILGRTIKGDNITFSVNEKFYKGRLMPVEEAMELIRTATIANLVGKEAVEEAIKRGIVQKESVVMIADVPHAQLIKLS